MKQLLFILFFTFIGFQMQAQDFVDIVKFNSNNTRLGNAENDNKSDITNLNLEVNYPLIINDKLILISGFSIENTAINFPELVQNNNLTSARINLGLKYNHSKKWTGTYVFFPKVASEFNTIGFQHFQIGGIAVFDYQYSEKTKLKLGLYSSTENFGIVVSPIVGFWHRTKNNKFYFNASLPIRFDVNYSLTNDFSLGTDFLSTNKSYNFQAANTNFYFQEISTRLAMYASYGFLKNSILLKGKVGLDATDYGLYNSNDKTGLQLLGFSLSKDTRNRSNPKFKSALFFGAELIYRFDLTGEIK